MVVDEVNFFPVDSFAHVLLLLEQENVLNEKIIQYGD